MQAGATTAVTTLHRHVVPNYATRPEKYHPATTTVVTSGPAMPLATQDGCDRRGGLHSLMALIIIDAIINLWISPDVPHEARFEPTV